MILSKTNRLLLLFLIIGVLAPISVFSQSAGTENEEGKSDEELIILSPAADKQVYHTMGSEGYSSQTGLIIGNRIFGIETIYKKPGARAELGLTITSYSYTENSAILDDNLLIGTLSFGRTVPISDITNSEGRKKLEVYFRIAPGFGVVGRGIIENGKVQYFPGVIAATEFGVIYHFTDRTSLFTNAGGRYYWFPGLDEMGLIGRPAVMIGLQFNFTGGFSMIRF